MHWRRVVYGIIGLSFIAWIVFSMANEISSPYDQLSWIRLSLFFIPAITQILLGGSMILDHKHLLNILGILLNFHPSSFMFRLAGAIILFSGLFFFFAGVLQSLNQ